MLYKETYLTPIAFTKRSTLPDSGRLNLQSGIGRICGQAQLEGCNLVRLKLGSQRVPLSFLRSLCRDQKSPVVIARRGHFRAAWSHRQQIGMTKSLGIIEDGDDAAVGAHHRRMPEIWSTKLREGGMALEHELDRLLPLRRIPHFRSIRRNGKRLDLRWFLEITTDDDRYPAVTVYIRVFLALTGNDEIEQQSIIGVADHSGLGPAVRPQRSYRHQPIPIEDLDGFLLHCRGFEFVPQARHYANPRIDRY